MALKNCRKFQPAKWVHERYGRQTDRQTGMAKAYSEREREFTFAKNCDRVAIENSFR